MREGLDTWQVSLLTCGCELSHVKVGLYLAGAEVHPHEDFLREETEILEEV
jgi:hypothetical protein